MILSFRQIKTKIRGVDNIHKITHAMEMISIAKLRPTQSQLSALKHYYLKIEELLKDLLADAKGVTHPLTEKRQNINRIALCLITSDTGLCSNYNNNIIHLAEDFINKNGREKIILVCVGRKGLNYFTKIGMQVTQHYTELNGRYSQGTADKILNALTDIFLVNQADEVYIAYTYFESATRYRPLIEKFLNIDSDRKEDLVYILEPDISAVLGELIPVYIFNKLKLIILNAFTAEHSTRVVAMSEATKNAKELLESLTLLRNKVRQASITAEIMEVVSSAEALR